MAKGKNVLTTGDVAKICNVAPRTVSKWFDNGQLKGYRIPGSKDRRIPVTELIRFMKTHNMPTSALAVGKLRVLVAENGSDASAALADTLREKTDYEVRTVRTNFEAGALLQKFAPHVLLIDLLAPEIDATGICREIHEDEDLQTIRVIALVNQLSDSEVAALVQKGFDSSAPRTDATAVVRKIEEVTAIIY